MGQGDSGDPALSTVGLLFIAFLIVFIRAPLVIAVCHYSASTDAFIIKKKKL